MPENVSAGERLERIVLEELHATAPDAVRERLGMRSEGVGTALVSITTREPSILLNRVIGLGMGAPATEQDVARVVELYREADVGRYFVHRHPEARPGELRQWLTGAGLERARGWMKFRRDASAPPEVRTTLRIERIGPERAADFGRIVATGFGQGPAAGEMVAALNGRPGWHQFMSFDGDTPAGTGVLFVHEGMGWLDMGATLPGFRGRRSQQALLAERIRFAGNLGCETLYTATGEEVPGDPQHSYRNILRMGFREAYLRENYAPPA